ncbi:unnamed protein product [Cuscuta campestris]|uniref:Uncharacterized protein n=1 Tax=Cuscuta campestris TaxID=132261 RepID=A0A484MQQ0_9ASTE|nr:unnamed protein product [Cuscuta campestris]
MNADPSYQPPPLHNYNDHSVAFKLEWNKRAIEWRFNRIAQLREERAQRERDAKEFDDKENEVREFDRLLAMHNVFFMSPAYDRYDELSPEFWRKHMEQHIRIRSDKLNFLEEQAEYDLRAQEELEQSREWEPHQVDQEEINLDPILEDSQEPAPAQEPEYSMTQQLLTQAIVMELPECPPSGKMDAAWMIPHGDQRTLRDLDALPFTFDEARKKFLIWGNQKSLQPPLVLDPVTLIESGHWKKLTSFSMIQSGERFQLSVADLGWLIGLYTVDETRTEEFARLPDTLDPAFNAKKFLQANGRAMYVPVNVATLVARFLFGQSVTEDQGILCGPLVTLLAQGLKMQVANVIPEPLSVFRTHVGYLVQIAYGKKDEEERPKKQRTIPMTLRELSQAIFAFQGSVESRLGKIEVMVETQQWQVEEIMDFVVEQRVRKEQKAKLKEDAKTKKHQGQFPVKYGNVKTPAKIQSHLHPNRRTLFSELLSKDTENLPGNNHGIFNGAPSISFSSKEEQKLAKPLSLGLVGRWSSRAKLHELEAFLIKGGYSEFKMRRLQKNDILFLFKREGDYLHWFSRRRWIVNGIIISISKRSPNYSPTRGSPIAPIWIKLEHLPVHLNDHGALFQIASLFGKPIKLDSNTVIGVFPEQPRFCVERDTSLQLPSRVHIRLGCKDLWIPYKFENPPYFCSTCYTFGHTVNNFRKHKLLSLTGKAPAGEVGHMGAGNKEDSAGWTWVKAKRRGKQVPNLGREGCTAGPNHSPFKNLVQQHVDNSRTGIPLPYVPPVFHSSLNQPSTSKQVKSHWSLLMPIIEDVNDYEALSTPSPSHKHNSVPLPPHHTDDRLALVPFSSAPGVPSLASNLFSKDDYWVSKPSLASSMCVNIGNLDKDEEISTLYCHFEGNEGDMPFDCSELRPFQVDISSSSATPMPCKKYLKNSKDYTPHAMETRRGSRKGTPFHLFALVMDVLTQGVQEGVPWCMLFADDIVLIDDTHVVLQQRRAPLLLSSVGFRSVVLPDHGFYPSAGCFSSTTAQRQRASPSLIKKNRRGGLREIASTKVEDKELVWMSNAHFVFDEMTQKM